MTHNNSILRGGRLAKTARGVVSLAAAAVAGYTALTHGAAAQELGCETTPTSGYEICPIDWENPIENSWGLLPYAVTPDGSVIVGNVGISSWAGAFRAVVGEDTFQVLPTLNDELGIDGYAGNYRYADANDITADGQIIVGSSWNERSGGYSTAVRWVAGPTFDGVQAFQLESLVPVDALYYSAANAVNSDGRFIVGASGYVNGADRSATLWYYDDTSNAPTQLSLGLSEDYNFVSAVDINTDGRVIVGETGSGEAALRWVQTGWNSNGLPTYEAEELGHLPYDLDGHNPQTWVSAVNADGTVVVGRSGGLAYRWVENGNLGFAANPEMQLLGTLDGFDSSSASDVSADGTVVVGSASWPTGEDWESGDIYQSRAFRWVAGGTDGTPGNPQMQDLGTLSGHTSSTANTVTADGSIVFGTSYGGAEEQPSGRIFIWRAVEDGGTMEDHANLIASFPVLGNDSAVMQAEQQLALERMMYQGSFVANGQTVMSAHAGSQITARNPTTVGARTTSLAALSFGRGISDTFMLGATISMNSTNLKNNAFDMDTGFGAAIRGQYSEGGVARTGLQFSGALGYMQAEGEVARGRLLTDVMLATGNSTIETRAMQASLGYGFQQGDWLVTPSLGVAHYNTTRAAYMESGAAFNASYDAMTTSRTVATLGITGEFSVGEQGRISLGVGVDREINPGRAQLTGTSDIPGLATFDIESTFNPNRTRAFATVDYAHDLGNGSTISGDLRVGKAVYGTTPSVGLGMTYEIVF